MTVNTLTPTPAYTIQNTGPYTITHGYSAKADIKAAVILANVRSELVLDTDYFVTPDSHDTAGTVTLSAAAFAAYGTGTLYISRASDPEQGWAAQSGPRETGLEAQLDAAIRTLQDQKRDAGNVLRADSPLATLTLKPSSLLGIDANGLPYFEDPNVLAQLVPDFAATAAYIDAQLNTRVPVVGNRSKVQTIAADHTLLVTDRSDTFIATADLTIDLLAGVVAAPGPNETYYFNFHAKGGVIYLSGSGAETVNGVVIKTIQKGEKGRMDWDATAGEWLCTIYNSKERKISAFPTSALRVLTVADDGNSPVDDVLDHTYKLAAGEVVKVLIEGATHVAGTSINYVVSAVSVISQINVSKTGSGSFSMDYGVQSKYYLDAEDEIANYVPEDTNFTGLATLTGPGTFTFELRYFQFGLTGAETANVYPVVGSVTRITDD